MNLENMSFGEVAEIFTLFGGRKKDETLFEIGKCYLIRTVTMMYTGRIIKITPTELLLEEAAWIADSGRYANALKEGTLNEVEPYPNQVIISRLAIIDGAIWEHPLPRTQK